MIRLRNVKKLVTVLMTLLILPISDYTEASNVYAETKTEDRYSDSINTVSKYLYLGDSKADSYNFRIVGLKQENIAEYNWYIENDKGNPASIVLDQNTGKVTARKTGTAYICCEIKLKDGTVLKPEAKVTVINNITAVRISNLQENMTLTAGQPANFNRTILDTSAGKDKKTQGITRWEISEDTAGAGSADNRGIVYPTKEGTFNIRAVCFQNELYYHNWLVSKRDSFITAASEWQTIKVVSSDGKAIATTQEQLHRALASESLHEVTLVTKKAEVFEIEQNDYSDKTLIVDTPNSDIHNRGKFQKITVKAIKDSTWIEYADGNIVYLSDNQMSFVIDAGAAVKQIVIDQVNSVINLEIYGRVDMISVIQPAAVNLTGSISGIPLTIEENAGQSVISTAIPINLSLHAAAQIKLYKGAENSSIDKSAGSIEVKVENNSIMPVVITTNKSGYEMINAGVNGISNESTIPIQSVNTINATGLVIEPQNMVLAVTGSAISMLVAEVTPANAAYSAITWRSADESVATVDSYGVVTPVAEGTTPIIATTGELYATATVTVVSGSAIAVTGSAIQAGAGLLQSVGTTIAEELAKGAVAYVGGQLMGWGLAQSGLGFKDESQTALDNMNKQLEDISIKLVNLEKEFQLAEQRIENAVNKAEFDIRVGQMTELISNIKSIREQLNLFITHPITNNPDLLERTRGVITRSIESKLNNNEDLIHNQLVGTNGQESLIKLYSRIIRNNSRFLSANDSFSVQSMYNYFEALQTDMLELMVEYWHANGEGGDNHNNIDILLNKYNNNITEQRNLLLPSVPVGVIIDTSSNIMVYRSYYFIDYGKNVKMSFRGPWYGNISSGEYAYNNMCYNYNFHNWRLITYDELMSWKSASNSRLGPYLLRSVGLIISGGTQIIIIVQPFPNSSPDYLLYYGYSVNTGEEVSSLHSWDGGKTYNDLTMNDCTKYGFYFIVCRTLGTNELSNYFW